MATVFLARLEGVAGFQRLYAIKRLHPHLANEAEFVDMFLDEARLAARIHHPNVVSILEVGTSEKGYYLVMEYIEGDTAARLLARSGQGGARLPTATGVRIAVDTLAGLHAAHELADDDGQPLHIVHRDVSPQNILVGIDGVSRITDFGVAHAATRLSSTRTGQLKGKLAYMAPEQARGAAVDRRSDVFAMGVVLWELLAGRRLFKASNDAETLHRILFAPVPTLRGAGVDVPVGLDAVCMRALEREPENRYGSAAEFGDDLERVARSAGMLSSTREVASYVDGTIGAEISQQREVVRAWLSRSEPSRNDRINITGLPDDRRAPRRSVGPPRDASGLVEGPPVPRRSSRDVTVIERPSGPSLPGSAQPPRTDVSSVSSAVLAVAGGEPLHSADHSAAFLAETGSLPVAQLRAGTRRGVWAVGVGAGLLAAVALGFALPRASDRARAAGPGVETTSTTSSAPVSPPPAASLAVPPLASAPIPAASGARAADPTAVPSSALRARPPVGPRPGGPVAPPRPARPATPRPDDLGDDLSHNPYR